MKRDRLKKTLIDKINKSHWWHVPPGDIGAYKKRGKFYASTFAQAEFYGRPNNEAEQVSIKNPVYGFSELEILEQLFPKNHRIRLIFNEIVGGVGESWYKKRVGLDKKMHLRAKKLGYDAIVLMTRKGKKALEQCRKPRSIELNVISLKQVRAL